LTGARALRTLLLFASGEGTKTLSYYAGWPRHFELQPAFDVTPINLLRRRDRVQLAIERSRYDVVVALHSTFSNTPYLRGRLLARARRLAPVKVFFVGNEYKLMPEKISFCERLGVNLLVTQLDAPEASAAYRDRLGCEVVSIPYTGLDTAVFTPGPARPERPIDLGYRAFDSPPYLGHRERAELAEYVSAAARRRGLRVDIALGGDARFDEIGWAAFLRQCKGQLGSEAGGDFFELTDARRRAVNEAICDDPAIPFEDLFEQFFASEPTAVSGRALSGRVVEAAGTKTVQILLEGRYGNYFRPDVHYIPLRKDFSNIDDALDKFADEAFCDRLVEAAHEVAHAQLTYRRLIDRLRDALLPLTLD
jgi:hypothetical protein